MNGRRAKPQYYVIAAAASFLIAAICFSGLIFHENLTVRLIFGAMCSVTGIALIVFHFYARLARREREVRDLREGLLAQARDTAAQQERNRLARELHDSIKQQLFSIGMSAAAVQARWESDPQGAQEALADVRRSAQEAMVEMNALLQQLSPVPLERVGLRQALQDQCEALGYRTGAQMSVEFGKLPDDDRLPPGAQESLFRITQETLSNVARHARASHVRLYLGQRQVSGPLLLEIEDNGQGFEVEREQHGMGLDNIRQRVEALKGDFFLDSSPGEGTALRASIPLEAPLASRREGMAAQRPDHRLNRAFLAGLGGGLMLIAVLFYPLYVLLPGRYVAGWPTGSGALGFGLVLLSPLLAAGSGYLAARWIGSGTRQDGTLCGALAGGVAGVILYFGLGAAAAGVAGNAPLLLHGLVPAAGEVEAVRLLAEAMIGVVWGTHGAFWAALLAGTGLGALGGLLSPARDESRAESDLRPVMTALLAAVALASALSFAVALLIFSALGQAIENVTAQYDLSLGNILPVAGAPLWPTGTPLILYFVSLIALWFLLRAELGAHDPARLRTVQSRCAEVGLMSLGLVIFVLLVGPGQIYSSTALRMVVVMAIAGTLILSALYLAVFVEVWRRTPSREGFPVVRWAALLGILFSLAVLVWAAALPSLLSVLAALLVVACDLFLGYSLARRPPPPPPDGRTVARLQWSMAQAIGAAVGSVVVLIVPFMALLSAIASFVAIVLRFPTALLANETVAAVAYVLPKLVGIVHNAYVIQAGVVLLAVVVASTIVGLLMLVNSGRIAVARRRFAQAAKEGE
jgi:signal transduction histidine kinase